jgi:hypothetical protein
MAQKVLQDVRMADNWTSYMASVEGALRGAGLWDEETYKMMGMTGMGFQFIVHETCCPSSVTVYDWLDEHMTMTDRIGVHSQQAVAWMGMNTFGLAQRDALAAIKASIDRGMAVVVWAPTPILEFGLITGYDDEDAVFLVEQCTGQKADPLLYTNLGKSEVSILYYQVLLERVAVPREKSYRESLKFGVQEWNRTQHGHPGYGRGRQGYDNLIASFGRDDLNPFGLSYCLAVYSHAKADVARYLEFLKGESTAFAGLGDAAARYGEVIAHWGEMASLVPFPKRDGGEIDRARLASLAQSCRDLEEKAMTVIGQVAEG